MLLNSISDDYAWYKEGYGKSKAFKTYIDGFIIDGENCTDTKNINIPIDDFKKFVADSLFSNPDNLSKTPGITSKYNQDKHFTFDISNLIMFIYHPDHDANTVYNEFWNSGEYGSKLVNSCSILCHGLSILYENPYCSNGSFLSNAACKSVKLPM